MKILSWNVNGLTSWMEKGYFDLIKKYKPDVICLQETKLNKVPDVEMPYNQFWNFADKKGYSGTAVFSKFNPLKVTNGIGNFEFDCEGRVITLEFKHFYLVNVYVPNSQGSLRREDYRDRFDVAFREYLANLQEVKPVIVCGDFNVPHKRIDIYSEHEAREKARTGFQFHERSNFDKLLEIGLIDVYRVLNPKKIEYSWWSQRFNMRQQNRGLRLDYFLVTESLRPFITSFSHLADVYGSDHCPLFFDINHRQITIDHLTDEELTRMWETIDWQRAEATLLDMQQKLTKSVFANNHEHMITLQNRIVHSDEAKALAVCHVSENSSGPGIDGVKWTTPADKMKAVLSLTNQDYKTQPFRHIVIHTKNKTKERRVSLPTMYDRAMQALYAYSLDPVAEAVGDRRSFAFRKGRSTQDVHSLICKCLSGRDAPEYVLITDVKSCYDNISHEWLLDNIPMDKNVLKEFLKSGFVFAGCLFPSEEGISLGSSLSPILGNMVLNGLQKYLYDTFYEHAEIDYPNGEMIRFADDILVTARTKADAERFKKIIADFLIPRGLKLSEVKTRICHTRDGFDFLSRSYSNKNGVIYSTPSRLAVERFEAKLKDAIFSHKGSQKSLIEMINKKLTGFATYHRVCDSADAFVHIDNTVNALLLEFCQKKHPKLPKIKIIEKYWYKMRDGSHIYAVPNKIECQVLQLRNVMLTRHRMVDTFINPYLDTEYFEGRNDEREIQNINGKYKPVWQRQNGKCYYCGQPILPDQQRTVVPIDISLPPSIRNLAYIHTLCKDDELSHSQTSDEVDLLTGQEVLSLLHDLHDNPTIKKEHRPFELLKEYFFNLELSPHTLSFDEIEKIMESPLCSSAYKHAAYWHSRKSGSISDCWLNNGYIIQNLHLPERYVVFRKEDTNMSKVIIPKVFTTQKIPLDAKYEIETYLDHIKKKYGL